MVNTGSFIPEKKGKTGTVRRKRKVYVLSYVAYTFFFGAALTVAGLFLWSLYLDGQIESASVELSAERQRFSQSDIERVRELDQRLDHAKALLQATPLVSQILTAVEETTPNNISFTSLNLVQTGADSNAPQDPFATTVAYNNYDSYTVTIEGLTDTFNKLLFQQNVLQNNPVLTTADVTQFSFGDTETGSPNNVSFAITTQVPFAVINTNTSSFEAPLTNLDFDEDLNDSFDEIDLIEEEDIVDVLPDDQDNF